MSKTNKKDREKSIRDLRETLKMSNTKARKSQKVQRKRMVKKQYLKMSQTYERYQGKDSSGYINHTDFLRH